MSLKYTWLPASTSEVKNPLHIVKATGSHLQTQDGQSIYDATASWWCKPLGHSHPLISTAINEQLRNFEHHIPVAAYNDVIEELSQRLISIFTKMDRVMYASDGSSAVEMALKLSYECRVISGTPERCKFLALSGGYHGETLFALSVCGIDAYKTSYSRLLSKNYFVGGVIYVNSRFDPKWHNCEFDYPRYQQLFSSIAASTSALIIEPLVQGAAGIKIISRDFLVKLIQLAQQYAIHIICDEIMVGLGRLGCLSVSKELLGCEPDFVCFAKNLTAGSIPMSALVINQEISQQFKQRSFAHSHTHSGNALAAKVALSYLNWLDDWLLSTQAASAETRLLDLMNGLALRFCFVTNPRAIGVIGACDLILSQPQLNLLFELGIKSAIYLRPIGKSLYVLPPLHHLSSDLNEIQDKLLKVLAELELLSMVGPRE